MNKTKIRNQTLTPQQLKKLRRLRGGIKKIIKSLDRAEIEAYAAHFYQYQELHQKYLKEGIYNEFWDIFRALKEGRIQNTQVHKGLGNYGLYLITKLNPSIWGKLNELDLIETMICFRNLTLYLEEEILAETKNEK